MMMPEGRVNAAPLGLMGFGMTTVLLNLHNLGLIDLNWMILGMGLFYGGLAQILAGILESRKGNTFATVAFCSYGFFWLSFVVMVVQGGVGSSSLAAYLIMWGIFTSVMMVGSLRMGRALQVIFITLVILYFLLAAAQLTGSEPLTRVAGAEGILCGASAIYLASAEILNEVYGRRVLPV